MRGIRGIEEHVLVNEIKEATEVCYPESEGKLYVNLKTVYMHIRDNAKKYPNINIANDKYMKQLIYQTYDGDFKWRRYANTKSHSGRSTIFYRGT
jgi:hypothetical protein